MIRRETFDLIVLDLMMPDMNGMQVLEKIREKFSRFELPVLIATAQAQSEDAVRALELGANDYVSKPIDFPVVKARIESHLQVRTKLDSMVPPTATFYSDGTAEPGTIVDGRYEVIATIGRGGFAVVFKARQLSTGQVVALKVMRPHRVSDGGTAKVELARFEREMDLIGRLNHPHIVRLIDSGSLMIRVARSQSTDHAQVARDLAVTSTGSRSVGLDSAPRVKSLETGRVYERTVPYIVMEFLDGTPLSALITNEAPMSIDRVVELMLPVVSAVGSAHQADVVHRDLKPPNIFVAHRQGRPHPKVLDFGIAKLTDDDAMSLTADAQFLGTPEYMAPEQARGESEIDAACDQYTLGVILYEATTGARPYQSQSFMKLVHMISDGECKTPSQILPDYPAAFERVVMRAMATEKEQRFTSIETFGRALLPFASEAVRARWEPYFVVPSDPPPPLIETPESQWPLPTQSDARTITSRFAPKRARVTRVAVMAAAVGFAVGVVLTWLATTF